MQKLDLLDNNITERGCTLLQEIISIDAPLQNLKLDHNLFGTQGLAQLCQGLALNTNLKSLSLNYCGIDSLGAIYI